ncbi:hypothetical protein NQ317_019321 [Molorchus minor]|uniref:TRAF3-interacting protein 1 N-terminal domain-containing protein n=1 Tax=Molorchus minor TaxID=1323400 RepID=A0ABQ9J547_9CUCU|nr:hypothetical protein NQ317_019321 [Molorchus minor]
METGYFPGASLCQCSMTDTMSEEINPDVIKKTQKILGKYVKKPPLTDKLLKKPPFRFLHDVVKAVISDTGYLNGLFSEDELKTENIKEKDDKIAFLNKLIDAVKATTKIELTVRSSKVVAGLESTKTNQLLQAIGKALDAKVDTSEYIAQLKPGKTDDAEKKQVNGKKEIKNRTVKKQKSPRENKQVSEATNDQVIINEEVDGDVNNHKDKIINQGAVSAEEKVRGSVQPKSARPKSGDRRASLKKSAENFETEILQPLEITTSQPSKHPKSSLRPPSVVL